MDKISPRAVTIKRLRKEADTLLQEIAQAEYPACEVCGSLTRAGHHFFPKGSAAELRYDLQNIVSLCSGCHVKHHRGSNPEIHAKVMRDRGYEWYDDLYSRKSTTRSRNKTYYLGVIKTLKARLGTKH
ncbi:hypothetical protein LCGC14_2484470 [marine sediment metagenome]|uniref:HNH domain-containing protein n=1 Tax=marine sediment metagenome TaxID=412755 RepID=A0A0F9E0A4_9ZZZZ